MITEIKVEEQLWHIIRHFGTMRYGVLTAMNSKNTVYWHVMLCSMIDESQHFGGIYVQGINGGSRFLQNGDAYQAV
jgi:hypothetical protein